MEVMFWRAGPRRYRVEVIREQAADLQMEPAPGYHDHIPHDLVHFFVESHWGLRNGVFGQLAAGGDAATFNAPGQSRRDARRQARKNQLSGSDIGRSEQLAALVTAAWELARAGGATVELARRAHELAISDSELHGAVSELDVLARQWSGTPLGGAIRVPWPWPERRAGRRASGQ